MAPTLKWDWVYDIVFVYSWAVAAGLVIGAMRGWALGLLVMAAVVALIYGLERFAHRVIRPSPPSALPQRRVPKAPH